MEQEVSCPDYMTTTTSPDMDESSMDESSMDDAMPCSSHYDCDADTPFCYDGYCDMCDQCQNCEDGIDGTCGPCGMTTSGDMCGWEFTVSMVMTDKCADMKYN